MNIDVKLSRNTLMHPQIETISLPEENLILNIDPGIFGVQRIAVFAKNGDEEIRIKPVLPYSIDLSKLLIPGIIKIEIVLLNGSEPIKNWRVEDIVVKEIDNKYMPISIIEELKGAIKEIRNILTKNNLL